MHRAGEREARIEERKSEFKKGITGDDATEKRYEEHDRLHKNRRDTLLKRIRRGGAAEGGGAAGEDSEARHFTAQQAQEIMVALQTGTAASRSAALRALCHLTAADEPHLATLHRMQVVPVLQKVLTGAHTQDQFDALWCLTNLASGDHATTAMLYPAVPYVIHLVTPENPPLAEQAVWCLGNIAGDCDECRARVVLNGAVDPLMALLRLPNPPPSMLQTLGFTLCNVLRGRQFVQDFVSKGLIALVLRLLTPNQPIDVVVEMCWVLTYITAGSEDHKASVLSLGGTELMVQLLEKASGNAQLLIPLLRIIGNLCNSPDALLMKLVTTKNFLRYLWNHMGTSDTGVLKELCWALGNLTGGPVEACRMVVEANFVPPLCALFNRSVLAVRKEIGYVLLNLCSALKSSSPMLEMLVATPGVMSSFVEFINLPDVDMIGMGIRWASIVLRYHPQGKEVFEQSGGLIALEDLEYNVHKNDALFSKANQLLDEYFTDTDNVMEDDQHNQPPAQYPPWRIQPQQQQPFSF